MTKKTEENDLHKGQLEYFMEARIFFELGVEKQGQLSTTLSNGRVVAKIRSLCPELFGSSSCSSSATKNSNSEVTPEDDRIASRLGHASADIRDDIYLVVSPECGGGSVGVKWRRVNSGATTLATLMDSGPVEVKVTADHGQAAIQSRSKYKFPNLSSFQPAAAGSKAAAASTSSAFTAEQQTFLRTLLAAFHSLSGRCLPAHAEVLIAVSEKLSMEQQRFPLVLATVGKSRRDVVLPGNSSRVKFNLEETDVSLLFGSGQKPRRTFRSWNLEPITGFFSSGSSNDGSSAAATIASKFLAGVSSSFDCGVIVASYPQFLSNIAFTEVVAVEK